MKIISTLIMTLLIFVPILSYAEVSRDESIYSKKLPINMHDIHFDHDRYAIREDAKPVLKDVASMLMKDPLKRVILEGHYHDNPSPEYSLGISNRLAESAKKYLVSLGVATERIVIITYGREMPLCTEHTKRCMDMNRRVSFVFIKSGGE